MKLRCIIHWFRQDLRLADNPALHAACEAASGTGAAVVPVYVLDDDGAGEWAPGGASRWWLHGSLEALDVSLRKIGSRLILRRGASVEALLALARETDAEAVHFTRGYEPFARRIEVDLKAACDAAGIAVRRFPGAALFEPEAIRTQSGGPFRVFTPFWKACLAAPPPRAPLGLPGSLPAPRRWPETDALPNWRLRPSEPDWAGGLRAAWQPGEAGGVERLAGFAAAGVRGYGEGRDRPDLPRTSRLSPHLHFGEVSARRCWHAIGMAGAVEGSQSPGAATFLRELGWREFSIHLLAHFPQIVSVPFRPEFGRFPWSRDEGANARNLTAWQRGITGYPIVDAGMRQLWQEGWMHNRVRMIAASFLTKHLLIPWQTGARWFWDTLVDADLASNQASWQWVAGSGADAAPYFRIFNPVLQGEKFDPAGDYVRRYVPELAGVPARHIHSPWLAPAAVLSAAGVELGKGGKGYPLPIVEHAKARALALEAYACLKA